MSSKELRRKTVMDEVVGGRRKLRSAAEVLQISYRQCRRVYQRYRQQGDQGLMHRNRGRASNRKIGEEQRGRILARYQQRYAGYGPTFASEKLAAEDWGWITRRCGVGCWKKGCGSDNDGAGPTVSGASGGSVLESWCRWTAVITPGGVSNHGA